MNKVIIFGLAIISLFLIGNVSSGIATSTPYAIGDSYTFSISDMSSSLVINGTSYSQPVSIPYANTNNITVTNITSSQVFFSYDYNGLVKNDSVKIDGFKNYMATLFILVGGNFNRSSPSTANFEKPVSGTTTSFVESVISSGIFGVFASGNTSAYKALVNNTLDSVVTKSAGYVITVNSLKDLSSSTATTYTISFDLSLTKSNATENFSYSFDLSYVTVIDLTTNVISSLSFSLNTNLKYGSATRVTKDSFKEIQGTLPTSSSSKGLPGFEFMTAFAFLSIVAVVAVIQKRRK